MHKSLETKEATLIHLQENGKTLMLHRNKDPNDFLYGKSTPIGGKLEPRETPEQCAHRELFEETGLKADLKYRGQVLFDNHKRTFNGKPAKYDWLVHIFQASGYIGELKTDLPEGTLEWVPDSDINNLNIEEGDRVIFEMLKGNEEIYLRIIHDGDRFERSEPL